MDIIDLADDHPVLTTVAVILSGVLIAFLVAIFSLEVRDQRSSIPIERREAKARCESLGGVDVYDERERRSKCFINGKEN